MNTDELVSHGRKRFDHAASKRTLSEKYQGKLVFAHAGGLFKATPELINFLKNYETHLDLVITDLYDNPVRVNVQELTRLARDRYQEQMSAWLLEYEELSKNR